MRKIVAGFALSVDGYIQGPKGEHDWILVDKEIAFNEPVKRFDAVFIGRKTYELLIAIGGQPVTGTTNYVFSNSLGTVDKDFVLIQDNVQEQVNQLKQQPGKDIAIFGGASLFASLLNMRLVDEVTISIIPVLLGPGKPMVDILTEQVSLFLITSKVYANGTVQLDYKVKYNNG